MAKSVGISLSYASEVLSGARSPSRPLAIRILRRTGWKHDSIKALTPEQIDTLEAVEPWRAAPAEQVAA
ncbi:MAG: hypothetical protein PGN16_03900 [Sphingomonas phyllosphaerae]